MFYAHFVLAKKGPMARIWLAAHWDKKLTRAHVFETNIEKSVDGILQPKVKMALRTTGHLLLGVVRIYSRKAKYLLADCNEAFSKMKVVFRPGMIDLPEDRTEAAPHVINLPDGGLHSDVKKGGKYQSARAAKLEDITLREDLGLIQLDFEEGFGEIPNVVEPDCDEEMEDYDEEMENSEDDEEDLSVLREPEEHEIDHEQSLMLTELPKLKNSRNSKLSREVSSLLRSGTDDGLFADFGFGDISRLTRSKKLSLQGPSLEVSNRLSYNPPSPGGISIAGGLSRPVTPFELEMPPPSIDESSRTLASDTRMASTTLRQGDPNVSENTTLLRDVNESFALEPVDASAIRGSRRKRKRRLVVDNVKAFSADYMKNQMIDPSDLVLPLDLAPPTKRLILMKETGTSDKLFILPGHFHFNSCLAKHFNFSSIEPFETLEMFGLLGESEGDVLALTARSDVTSNLSRARGMKRKADEQLLPENESIANKENEELLQIQNQTPEVSNLLGQRNPLQSINLENVPSSNTPGFVTPASKRTSKTPSINPSVTAEVNENSECEAIENIDADIGDDHFDLGGPDETYDPPVENLAQSTTPKAQTPTRLNSYASFRRSVQLQSVAEDEHRGDDPNAQSRRATRLHKDLENFLTSTVLKLPFSKLTSNSSRKQAAQKFYSVLILHKAQAIRVDQADEENDMFISRGRRFETAVY